MKFSNNNFTTNFITSKVAKNTLKVIYVKQSLEKFLEFKGLDDVKIIRIATVFKIEKRIVRRGCI